MSVRLLQMCLQIIDNNNNEYLMRFIHLLFLVSRQVKMVGSDLQEVLIVHLQS